MCRCGWYRRFGPITVPGRGSGAQWLTAAAINVAAPWRSGESGSERVLRRAIGPADPSSVRNSNERTDGVVASSDERPDGDFFKCGRKAMAEWVLQGTMPPLAKIKRLVSKGLGEQARKASCYAQAFDDRR